MARALIPNSTQVPDVIIDQWMAVLSGAEFKVLLYIARRTYGFGKEADNISLNQLANGIRRRDGTQLDRGTGLSRTGVKEACKGLIQKGLLIRTANRVSDGHESEESTYRLNLFAAVPMTEAEEVGQKEAYPGQFLAHPEVGQKKTRGRPESNPGVGQKLALQETEQETEQETAAAGTAGADADLVEALVKEGSRALSGQSTGGIEARFVSPVLGLASVRRSANHTGHVARKCHRARVRPAEGTGETTGRAPKE